MPIDFSPLQQIDPAGAFFRGREAAQAEADRNMLRQAQAEQRQFERENMLAQRGEREALAAERRRATEAQNALAAYSQSGQPMTSEALARFGAPGLALAKSLREERAGQIEQELKVLEYASRRLAAATPETYAAIRADLSGINPRFGASLPQEFNPEQVMSLARQGMSLKDQIESATRQTVVAPGATVLQGGKPIYTAPAAEKPYEPSELQKTLDDLSKAPPGSPQQKALQARVQMLTTREPKEPREAPAPTITQIQDPADPNRMITIDARRYSGGTVGAPGVIGTSGKTAPAAAAEQKKIAAQGELQNVIDTLKTAYADLDAMRAVPSEQRNVISNALSYIASTGVGQVAGRIGGTEAQTQRDVIQASRNLLFTAVKNATGKTSGELNSNVEFKAWLKALTDPSQSIQANQTILENLEKFVASGGNYSAKRGGGEVKPAPAAPPAPAGFPAPPQAAIDALRRGQGTDAQFDAIFGPGAAARARRQ
jgi:hypothetical protein